MTQCGCADHRPTLRVHTFDEARAQRTEKVAWRQARMAEVSYGRQLRSVGVQIGKLVQALSPQDQKDSDVLQGALRKYAEMLDPWAKVVARRMIADVERRDFRMWAVLSREMGYTLRQELSKAPTGLFLRGKLEENVALITSLPIEAGQRVHELTLKGLTLGTRPKEIADEIMRTGEVTQSRATLIARTEVARTASGLVEARALHVGSDGYLWRTVMDSDVRNVDGNPVGSHRKLEGKFIPWNAPPIASTNGTRAHAGQIYNCRCWPEPVIPKQF